METSKKASATPRETIIEIAVRLFSEHGYTGTTMRDIAKAVGVLPGSLYAHIESKEALLAEIVHGGIQHFLGIEQRLGEMADASPEAKLRMAIDAHVEAVARSPERTLVVFHQWRFLGEPARTQVVAKRRRYAQLFMDIVQEGIATGAFSADLNARIAVFGILGALNWVPEWYSPEGKSTAMEIGETLADSLLFGLRKPDAGSAN